MSYEALLANAPDQTSEEFLAYLRTHNKVVHEDKNWLVIENAKYHTTERPWHTAFHKQGMMSFRYMMARYWEWEWLKKAKEKQTVPNRFHMHFYRP